MKHMLYSLFLLLSAHSAFTQSITANETSNIGDAIAMANPEEIVLLIEDDTVLVQSPSDTYMLEVVNENGTVQAQESSKHFMSIDISNWNTGNYMVLAHTFNGLVLGEFNLQR